MVLTKWTQTITVNLHKVQNVRQGTSLQDLVNSYLRLGFSWRLDKKKFTYFATFKKSFEFDFDADNISSV